MVRIVRADQNRADVEFIAEDRHRQADRVLSPGLDHGGNLAGEQVAIGFERFIGLRLRRRFRFVLLFVLGLLLFLLVLRFLLLFLFFGLLLGNLGLGGVEFLFLAFEVGKIGVVLQPHRGVVFAAAQRRAELFGSRGAVAAHSDSYRD